MRTPESVLREFGDALDLPARRKVVLLRELRADLEGAISTLVTRGCSPRDAQMRALELLAPTVAAADSLSGLHRPPYVGMAHRLPGRLVRVLEWGSIGCLAAVGGISPILGLRRISDLPPWAAGVLGCVILMVLGHLSWNAFRLFVRQDTNAAVLARAGETQAGLIALTLAVGTMVVALQAYGLFGSWADGRSPDPTLLVESVLIGTATAAVVLGTTILGVVGAVVLLQSFLSIRDTERELARLLGLLKPSERFDADP